MVAGCANRHSSWHEAERGGNAKGCAMCRVCLYSQHLLLACGVLPLALHARFVRGGADTAIVTAQTEPVVP